MWMKSFQTYLAITISQYSTLIETSHSNGLCRYILSTMKYYTLFFSRKTFLLVTLCFHQHCMTLYFPYLFPYFPYLQFTQSYFWKTLNLYLFCHPPRRINKNTKPLKSDTFAGNWLFSILFYILEVKQTVRKLDSVKFY